MGGGMEENDQKTESFIRECQTNVDKWDDNKATWVIKLAADYHNLKPEVLPKSLNPVESWCSKGVLPDKTLMSGWVKSCTWVNCLIKLHYAGRPTEQYSDEELGLSPHDGAFKQHQVYRLVMEKLRECNGAKTYDQYKHFMNWLAMLDIGKVLPAQNVIDQLPEAYKTIRPDLCDYIGPVQNQSLYHYDPNYSDTGANITLYPIRHFYCKDQMFKAFLKYAPKELSMPLLQDWLTTSESQPIRAQLFKQNHYPLSTFMYEVYSWSILIEMLSELLPEMQQKKMNH